MSNKIDKSSLSNEWGPILPYYEPIKVLGSGSYGKVIEAVSLKTKKKVAIKRVNCLFEDLIDTKRILREITLLRFMKNKFIVELLDIEYDHEDEEFDCIFLIFECLPSDLKKIIKSSLQLSMKDVKLLVYHILCGLKYIHSCAVLHRDLKPGNILLDDNYAIKICDFGLARCVNRDDEDEIVEQFQDDHRSLDTKKLLQRGQNMNKYLEKKEDDSTKDNSKHESKDENKDEKKDEKKDENKPKRPPTLKEMKEMKKKKNEQILSVHVVSRWYRAPELILIESDYGSEIDVWSVGCIFAELMTMMKENAPTFMDRKPLFPGKFCFPLSPPGSKKVKVNEFGFPNEKTDQLNVIFDVIGTPGEEDMGFISDPNGILYLKSLKQRPKLNLKKKFPGSNETALDLLEKMIIFNPNKRITVQQALEHPFFKDVRDKEKEIEADFNLEFEFEKDENLTMEKLRELFLKVMKSYKTKK